MEHLMNIVFRTRFESTWTFAGCVMFYATQILSVWLWLVQHLLMTFWYFLQHLNNACQHFFRGFLSLIVTEPWNDVSLLCFFSVFLSASGCFSDRVHMTTFSPVAVKVMFLAQTACRSPSSCSSLSVPWFLSGELWAAEFVVWNSW